MKEEEHECVGHVNLALEPDHLPGLQPRNSPWATHGLGEMKHEMS